MAKRYKSGLKELRKARKRALENKSFKRKIRTTTQKLVSAIDKQNKESATHLLSKVYSLLDKAAKKGIFHYKNVARKKSKLCRLVRGLSV